jgi:hypothetical protein
MIVLILIFTNRKYKDIKDHVYVLLGLKGLKKYVVMHFREED